MHLCHACCAVLIGGLLVIGTGGCRSPAPAGPDAGEPGLDTAAPAVGAVEREPATPRSQALAHFATGISLELNEEPAAALDHFRQAAAAEPGETDLVLDVARRYLEQKQPEQAIAVLEGAARERPADPDVLAWLGAVYAQAGRKDEAIATSKRAVRQDPAAIMAYQTLVDLALEANDPAAAVQWTLRAGRVRAEEPAVLVQVADLHLSVAQKRPQLKERLTRSWLGVLDRLEALQPENPAVQQRLADHLRALGELGRAEPIYTRLLEKYPNPLLRERLADIYLRTNRKDLATAQLEAIKREFPANANIYFVLGGLAADDRRWDDAVGHFENSIRLNPEFEQAYYELAGVRLSMNRAADALDLLAKVRERFKPGFLLEFYTGLARMQLKEYAAAVQSLAAAEGFARDAEPARLNAAFLFQIGAAHERAGDRARAVDYFKRCLEREPDFAEALNYLGYMWAEHGENLVEARRLIERALKIEPENAAFLDSMAWVMFKLGHAREALGWMQKAIAKAEEPDATLQDHLGDILAALNQHAKAREAWRKSLEIEPSEAVRSKLERSEAHGRP